jgi:hypothetical protein
MNEGTKFLSQPLAFRPLALTLTTFSPVNKLTVSVVGGDAGGRLSLAAAACSEYYELVALADLRPEVGMELQEKFPGLRFFVDFREMFREIAFGRPYGPVGAEQSGCAVRKASTILALRCARAPRRRGTKR